MIGMGSFLLRAGLTGVALWVVTLLVPGIEFVGGESTAARIGVIFVVAVIFGVVNAVIKPIVSVMSTCLIVLTLGLFMLVVNALMLMLTSWIGTQFGIGFHVDGFWAALFGSIIISVVGAILGGLLGSGKKQDSQR